MILLSCLESYVSKLEYMVARSSSEIPSPVSEISAVKNALLLSLEKLPRILK